jgi:NitT/TauT family transport system permease protein
MNWRKALFDASPWLTTIGLFMLWEVACRLFKIPPFILPAPSQAVEALIEYWSGIWLNASHTFVTTLIGFAIAVVFGVALGVAVGASPLLYRALAPVLIGFNSIPKVAVVPILVLWFGIGTVPAVLTAFLVAFFPISVNVATGIATMEPELEDVLRSLGASKLDILWRVGLPRSLPYFFASLKIAITLAFV